MFTSWYLSTKKNEAEQGLGLGEGIGLGESVVINFANISEKYYTKE